LRGLFCYREISLRGEGRQLRDYPKEQNKAMIFRPHLSKARDTAPPAIVVDVERRSHDA
jgi:hypothetical protein